MSTHDEAKRLIAAGYPDTAPRDSDTIIHDIQERWGPMQLHINPCDDSASIKATAMGYDLCDYIHVKSDHPLRSALIELYCKLDEVQNAKAKMG